MKSKITKIFLFVLVAVMLFGTISPVAYESYETYTYSIDGKALQSPHAYTPDVNTYDSSKMGLLEGYFWRYNDDGDVAIWAGTSMEPLSNGVEYSDDLVYALNPDGQSYSVTGAGDVAYIEIPATYEGLPVTKIADGAFGNVQIKSIVIGENVTEIGVNALTGLINQAEIFYASTSEDYKQIKIDGTNTRSVSASRVYYYSDAVKFGNKKLALANDITSDNEGNLYIADKENNRIVVLNKYSYKVIGVMGTYVDEYGSLQTLNAPTGVFVTDPTKMVDGSSFIFVCDNGNKRIVVFDREYNYVKTIEKPNSALLEESAFQPYAIAVDKYGRIFVVSQSCFEGIIVLSSQGDFTGFIGAQKVTYNIIQHIWRRFQTAEQRAQSAQNLPMSYNNITVDDDGFVYATINFTENDEKSKQLAALKSKQSTYSPVKKLNSTGVEIMKRNGFFDPGGEVDIFAANEVSRIIDVALGDEGSWTILDNSANEKSGRIRAFTYDQNGNLLFAFGDKGDQVGNGEDFVAMTYQVIDGVYNLIFLDNSTTGFKITIFHPTDYCDTIMSALHNENENNFLLSQGQCHP